jgi:hypothetical protein
LFFRMRNATPSGLPFKATWWISSINPSGSFAALLSFAPVELCLCSSEIFFASVGFRRFQGLLFKRVISSSSSLIRRSLLASLPSQYTPAKLSPSMI